jgi:hypothetical protein
LNPPRKIRESAHRLLHGAQAHLRSGPHETETANRPNTRFSKVQHDVFIAARPLLSFSIGDRAGGKNDQGSLVQERRHL